MSVIDIIFRLIIPNPLWPVKLGPTAAPTTVVDCAPKSSKEIMANAMAMATAMATADEERAVKNLHQDFPKATLVECRRFWRSCRDDEDDSNPTITKQRRQPPRQRQKRRDEAILAQAEANLEAYLEWRERYGLDDGLRGTDGMTDAACWDHAVRRSLQGNATNTQRKQQEQPAVPQIIFQHSRKVVKGGMAESNILTDRDGHKVLHVLPARMDKEAYPAQTYGLALAFYLDSLMDRDSDERRTILLDVRAGKGWSNPSAVFMVNYVCKIVKVLQRPFPGRLEKLIVYPMPGPALHIWNAIKWVFHTNVRNRIFLVPGTANTDSPLPKSYLLEWLDQDVLDDTEKFRLGLFVPAVKEMKE